MNPERMFLKWSMGIEFWTTHRTKYLLDNTQDLESYRCVDFTGKRVLDIGGFSGETAVLFHHWGATEVNVVEGAEENLSLIRANLDKYGIRGALIHAMVGAEAGKRTINFAKLTGSFGLDRKPAKHQREVAVRTMSSVLDEVGPVDVIKCDCEGGEMGFTTCTAEQLRRCPTYVMETHSIAIAKAVVGAFCGAGFAVSLLGNGIWKAARPFYTFTRQ